MPSSLKATRRRENLDQGESICLDVGQLNWEQQPCEIDAHQGNAADGRPFFVSITLNL